MHDVSDTASEDLANTSGQSVVKADTNKISGSDALIEMGK